MADYTVYIVRCSDGSLYTGVARDLGRRIGEHNGGLDAKGARYTASRRPVSLVYSALFQSRSAAMKEEIRIKRLTRLQKENLIASTSSSALSDA